LLLANSVFEQRKRALRRCLNGVPYGARLFLLDVAAAAVTTLVAWRPDGLAGMELALPGDVADVAVLTAII